MATPTTLPATFVAGNILTAAQMNDLRGAFRVLQVVNATYSTATSAASTTFVSTGLSATITPTSTSSKILCIVQQNGVGKDNNTYVNLRLYRGASSILEFEKTGGYTGTATSNYVGTAGTVYLDSPATVAATTYSTYFNSGANVASAVIQNNSSTSTITLMEISA
jgi:hypothetical protein